MSVELDGKHLTLERVEAIADGAPVRLSDAARDRVVRARAFVEQRFREGEAIYGVTTGFGRLANVPVSAEDAERLQVNLVRSHAAGTGAPLEPRFVRAAGALRVNSLAAGHSGVRLETLVALARAAQPRRSRPYVPSPGLRRGKRRPCAARAHDVDADRRGRRVVCGRASCRARSRWSAPGLQPVRLSAKEGLALVNGTQVMTGIAALGVLRAQRLAAAADVIGAMSLEAFLGTDRVFDRRINELRPHPGQARVAENLRALLASSRDRRSRIAECGRVQDPYSYRCIPVVHGAVRDAIAYVAVSSRRRRTRSPITRWSFPEDGEFLSGGNFHGEPVALAIDFLKFAITELASIGERRLYLLLNGEERDLPLFLTGRSGVQSGLMIVQYTAAALVNENKGLAWPSSVDSIPTSAGQEDHVSMGMTSANNAAARAR